MLQAELGDGGPGFVLAARPWGWYGHQGIRIEAKGWTAHSPLLVPGNGGRHGLGLVSFTSAVRLGAERDPARAKAGSPARR